MNARTQREFSQRKTLRNAGWDVPQQDMVAFNSGSETLEHFLCKAILAFELKQQGFRVASEVEGPGGEIDLIGYGTEDMPIAIEAETEITEETVEDKLERYVINEPLRECFVLEVTDMPSDIHEAREWAGGQL